MRRLVLISMFLAGCEAAPSSLLSPTQRPDASVDPVDGGPMLVDLGPAEDLGVMPPVDAGPLDTGVDAGPPPDVGPPRRTLVEFTMYGEAGPENQVLNPRLDLAASLGPGGFGNLERFERWGTPGGMPYVQSRGSQIVVPIQGRPGLRRFRVWVGNQGRPPTESPIVLGLDRQLNEVQLRLVAGEQREHEGIVWVQYEAMAMEPSRGLLYLFTDQTQFLTAPEAIGFDLPARGPQASLRLATPRPMTPRMRANFERIKNKLAEHSRQNIGLPEAERRLKQEKPIEVLRSRRR